MKTPQYDLQVVSRKAVEELCLRYHAYQSSGRFAVYSFGVIEDGRLVAGYLWQPPPPGAARSVCPQAPHGVLALSRMVAVPRDQRRLRHVSRPLRRQMRLLIDRTRWPVLVTYSDEGAGHTGHVYRCSGWMPTARTRRRVFEDGAGQRRSSFSNGRRSTAKPVGWTTIQRWEHWADRDPAGLITRHWRRVPIEGRRWASGAQAFTYERIDG